MLPFGKAELERQHCEVQERSHRNFSSDRPRYHTTQVGRSGWQRANKELESMVAQRTNPLRQVNEQLLAEIAERRQVEIALRKSESVYRTLIETIPYGIEEIDTGGFITFCNSALTDEHDIIQNCNVYANRQAEAFFGCTQAEIQAKSQQFFAEVFHPDEFQHLAEYIARFAIAKAGEVIENEYRMKNAKGEWRWLHSREVVFTRNSQGIPEQILGTAIDITKLKQAEEIRLALEKEKELSQLQRRFFHSYNSVFSFAGWKVEPPNKLMISSLSRVTGSSN